MRYRRSKMLSIVTLLVLAIGVPALSASALTPQTAPFQRTWARTDQPVAANNAGRTWMWGPGGFTAAMMEPYQDTPGGSRIVQYFDKSRMEITYPQGDPNSIWYVTNGLLVVEMVEGFFQTGDEERDESPNPADVNIAGDPGERPTYADINRYGLRNMPARPEGTVITERIDAAGNITTDPSLASMNVTAAHRLTVNPIDHTVASVFWNFMNSTGLVYENGQYVDARLFQDPFYATGYPITEAYWSSVSVGGTVRNLLWQCFERRCLTYDPSNPPEWQIEMGNVGQHYYRWRYNTDIPSEPPAVDLAEYDALGPAPLGAWPVIENEGQSWVGIANQSPYPLTVRFDGATSHTMTIPACPDCIVYPSDAAFQGCEEDIPFDEALLPPGNYRVQVAWAAGDVIPLAGPWTLVPNADYGICFYVVEQ